MTVKSVQLLGFTFLVYLVRKLSFIWGLLAQEYGSVSSHDFADRHRQMSTGKRAHKDEPMKKMSSTIRFSPALR